MRLKITSVLVLSFLLISGMAFAEIKSFDKVPPVKSAPMGYDRGLLDCSGAIEVDLGVGVYYGDNTGAVNNVTAYSCSGWSEDGGEVVYHVVFPDLVTWEVGLTDMDCDLDLAVLSMCDEDLGCEIVVNVGVYVEEPVPGEFWFVVDGYNGAACSYTLTFTTTPYEPPPPAPDVDFCDLVEDAEGTGFFYGNTCDGQNLIYDLGCNNYTDNGLEDYYGVVVGPGGSFTATVTHESDTAAWILGECFGPEGVFTCLDHADDTYTGDPEVATWTNDTGVEALVYIVVDSWATDSCGAYEMEFQGTDAVANELMSIGDVKALYR